MKTKVVSDVDLGHVWSASLWVVMKILYYSPHPHLALNSQSGYGTHMREMIQAFERAGHEVLPVIMGGVEETYNSEESPSAGRRVKNTIKKFIPRGIWQSLRDLRLVQRDRAFEKELAAQIDDFKPDFIYERSSYLQPSGVRVAREYGLPHILEVNAPYVEEKEVLSGARSALRGRAERIEKEQLVHTTKVAIVSSTLKEHFVQKHGVAENKFIVVPNAINPEKASVDRARVLEIIQRHDLEGAFVAGFVGSIFRWHRADLLIKACHQLQEKGEKCKVLIVGDGVVVPELKQLRDRLGVRNQVVFTGRVPHEEVFNYIQAMDATVMPSSNWYGSPVKIFEYGAMDKPIIAPDNGPVRDVMESSKDGILIDPEVDDLTKALTSLIEDDGLRSSLARNFKQKVFSQFTWDRNAAKVLDCVS